jgi:Eco29kI restriction endonuclease
MKSISFDRKNHIYRSEVFVELVKDAVRFFNGTPVYTLPPPETFLGTGVYALYYIGHNPLYERYAELNRLAYSYPIYVGKAVPKGWRQSRISDNALTQSRELHNRLKEHSRSQAKSDWDVIHPGRSWAERCNGTPQPESIIASNIENHFKNMEGRS